MQTKMGRTLTAVLALALLPIGSYTVFSNQAKSTKGFETKQVKKDWIVSVKSCELGRHIEVLGATGLPVWQLMTIRGTWVLPVPSVEGTVTKVGYLYFQVTEVNGSPLPEPVSFEGGLLTARVDDVKIPSAEVGESWELRGYERVEMKGTPSAYYLELGMGVPQHRFSGFVTEFVYFKSKKIK